MWMDKHGREWSFRLDFRKAKLIEERTGINVFDIENIGNISERISTFLDVIWCIIGEQANEKSVTRDSFETCLDGDAAEAIADEVTDAIINGERSRGIRLPPLGRSFFPF